MFTLGYAFRPWTGPKSIADGGDILDYIRETVAEHDIDRHVGYNRRVVGAEWSSEQSPESDQRKGKRGDAATELGRRLADPQQPRAPIHRAARTAQTDEHLMNLYRWYCWSSMTRHASQ